MNSVAMQNGATPGAKAKTIGLWILKIAFGFMFLGAAGAKMAGVPAMVADFETIGLGQWFRYVTGGVELVGGILLLVPRTAVYGALLLAAVCVGALFAQVMALHKDWVHTVVMAGLMLFIACAQRSRDMARAG